MKSLVKIQAKKTEKSCSPISINDVCLFVTGEILYRIKWHAIALIYVGNRQYFTVSRQLSDP